ncbi:aminopeptidase N [Algiphilus sp.]|uniref:aminopeptidase N n=1 Tax=Algiphilus sp. TaxID=1872431 RepID=UPI003B51B07C
MADDRAAAAPHSGAGWIRRADYQPPDYHIDSVELAVDVDTRTLVRARLEVRRDESAAMDAPLWLDARDVELLSIAVDGEVLDGKRVVHGDDGFWVHGLPAECHIETQCAIHPEQNTALEGFYASGPMYCTQCEAHGFSRITPFIDRPDVLSRFRVRLTADASRFPVLLANGDCVERGTLDDGRHFAVWEDPFRKPCYLFAMVAGDLALVRDEYRTSEDRPIALEFYVDHGSEGLVDHAMNALKQAMRWDEEVFGLHYDLDTYIVVAARAFNMGAMENKGLNIFNSSLVLASTRTATDATFDAITSVIAHEYFHNYTGNRVTCRDWFQLSLKEGLTVFRDQRFSEDVLGASVQRIEQARALRAVQFPEDAGPTAHPVRPEAYKEVNNFYTPTVYEKGAEIVRMMHARIGEQAFREGLRAYLKAHDGTAATIEDFVQALATAANVDLDGFLAWYGQAGTPRLRLRREWLSEQSRVRLHFSQSTPPTPGQPDKQPLPIPIRMQLLDAEGGLRALPEHPARQRDDLLLMTDAEMTVDIDSQEPLLPACLMGLSAPVILEADYSSLDLQRLAVQATDPYVRWDALQQLHAQAHRALMVEDDSLLEPLLVSLQRIAAAPPEDEAFTAMLLAPPALSWLWEQYETIDPQRFMTAFLSLKKAVARALCGPLSVWAQRNPIGPNRAGPRALTNVALGYLLLLQPDTVLALARRRVCDDNMTLAMAALQGLNQTATGECTLANGAFYERWRNDALVLDRWFAVQAGSPHCTVEGVQQLLDHPDFDWQNPNRVRAVVATFARDNIAHFHSEGGYRLYAEILERLDRSNPQIAARLCRPMIGFARLEEPWSSLQRAAVESLRGRVHSANVLEMLDAALPS